MVRDRVATVTVETLYMVRQLAGKQLRMLTVSWTRFFEISTIMVVFSEGSILGRLFKRFRMSKAMNILMYRLYANMCRHWTFVFSILGEIKKRILFDKLCAGWDRSRLHLAALGGIFIILTNNEVWLPYMASLCPFLHYGGPKYPQRHSSTDHFIVRIPERLALFLGT